MNELDSTFDLLEAAVIKDDIPFLVTCCASMTEFPWSSFFHRNTLDLCIKHNKVDTLKQLQNKCPHNQLNVWPAYSCIDIAKGGNIDLINLAISQGCNLYPHTIHLAAKHGHIDMFKYLLTKHFLYDNLNLKMQFNVWQNVIQHITQDNQGEMFQWCVDQGYSFPEEGGLLMECLDRSIKYVKVNSTSSSATWWRKFLLSYQFFLPVHSHLHKKKRQSANFELYLEQVDKLLHLLIHPYQLHAYVWKCL